jgi:hypothetical protein
VGSESEPGCNMAGGCNAGGGAKVVCDISLTEGTTITGSDNAGTGVEFGKLTAFEQTPHRS